MEEDFDVCIYSSIIQSPSLPRHPGLVNVVAMVRSDNPSILEQRGTICVGWLRREREICCGRFAVAVVTIVLYTKLALI
jgi:hypothetical protein